jgi:hypothetical protein
VPGNPSSLGSRATSTPSSLQSQINWLRSFVFFSRTGGLVRPEDIVSAFDECRDYVFGRSLGRDNPHASDLVTAKRWVSEGLTLTIAVIVFHEQMSWMHEKFLRFGDGKDRRYLPTSLKVFNENIETAIRRMQNGGHFDTWESEILKWRSRCKGWKKDPNLWRAESWGPPPFHDGCMVPREVLKELKQ